VFFVGFAIGRTGVVDPARIVAAAAAVDHAAVVQAEVEGMVDRAAGIGRALGGVVPADALAPVFDDAFAGIDVAAGEDAVTVDRGLLHFIGRIGLGCDVLGCGGHGGSVGMTGARCAINIITIMVRFARLCST